MDRAGKSEAIKWHHCWKAIRAAIASAEEAEKNPSEWKAFLSPTMAKAAIEAGLVRPEDVVVTRPIPTDYPPH